MFNFKSIFLTIIFILVFFAAVPVFSQNIDSTYKWAWSPNIGWIDFINVTVGNNELTGYATSSGVGPISMNCSNQGSCASSNYKVNNSVSSCLGAFAGWAWNENIGWISFCGNASGPSTWNGSKWVCPSSPTYQVFLENDGSFRGWAWSNNIGWISFNCLDGGCTAGACSNCGNWKVKTSSSGTVTTSGEVISQIYDSQIAGGIAYNVLRWQGSEPSASNVKFQIASSRCGNGATNPPTCTTDATWNNKFRGYDGTAVTWYEPAVNSWIKIDGSVSGLTGCMSGGVACHNNSRYFRYKVLLESQCLGISPTVEAVALSWSP